MKKRLISTIVCGLLLISAFSLIGCKNEREELKKSNEEWFEKATKNQHELEELEKKLK